MNREQDLAKLLQHRATTSGGIHYTRRLGPYNGHLRREPNHPDVYILEDWFLPVDRAQVMRVALRLHPDGVELRPFHRNLGGTIIKVVAVNRVGEDRCLVTIQLLRPVFHSDNNPRAVEFGPVRRWIATRDPKVQDT